MAEPDDDLLAVLDRWHGEVRRLTAEIRALPPVDSWPRGEEVRATMALVDQLQALVVRTETAKERFLWPLVRRAMPPLGADLAASGLAEKERAEDLFLRMSWADDRSSDMAELIDAVVTHLRRNVAREERLAVALGALDPVRRQAVGRRMARMAARSPRRPYPALPTAPWAAATIAPLVGAVDRLRTALAAPHTGD